MGTDGSAHWIGFVFSAVLQKSALIDLHHSASVRVCDLLFSSVSLTHYMFYYKMCFSVRDPNHLIKSSYRGWMCLYIALDYLLTLV